MAFGTIILNQNMKNRSDATSLQTWYSFIVYIKSENIYIEIIEDVEKTIDAPNYKVKRPAPIGQNKKMIRLMKDELGGNILAKSFALGTENIY